MFNTIKFCIDVTGSENLPQSNLLVCCKCKTMDQSFTCMTDSAGKVSFEFNSNSKSIEVEIAIRENKYPLEIQNGDLINFRLTNNDEIGFVLN